MAFTTLAHHLNLTLLLHAFHATRKDGAPGVDGLTGKDYSKNLLDNLRDLLNRAKSGNYRAPPVRRVHIPNGTGHETRPLGIPTFEDKLLQRAVVMLLEPLYEQDFLDCSYGFRPDRSAHQALQTLWEQTTAMKGGWILEVDIRKFFDTLDHSHLRELLQLRVRDGVILRLIGKWLNAGVLEDGAISTPEAGTPQGGVISPLLANIYLHYVLDEWFERQVKPRLRGRAFLVRYADDFVIGFESEEDARRVQEVLGKRFAKYGLTLHPDKTRLVAFNRPTQQAKGPDQPAGATAGTFDLLGFTHYWGKSWRGKWVVKRKTASSRLRRAIKRIADWCRKNLHEPVGEQHQALKQKLQGHYGYYGITGNVRGLNRFLQAARRLWKKWLGRRRRGPFPWSEYLQILERFPLPPPRVVHSVYRA
ncbi:MAG: group II intron reverse transcriptase/maturase [Gemmatimonadales bacterium]